MAQGRSRLTRRLYYEDSFLREFNAIVVDVMTHEGAPHVELDRTAFYPGGGGQPPDRGVIDGVPVADVLEADGRLWHRLEREIARDVAVKASIDWTRRFDHMQQHTGQHILSQAFIEVASAETRSFHLGESEVVVDVDHAGPDAALLSRVEERANEIVWEDREVRVHEVPRELADRFPLRKVPQVEGLMRVVEVSDFDWSACGGTHVRRSGQVGVVSVLGTERYKGGTRVTFVCGGRALRRARERAGLLKGLCLEFTSGEADLPRAVAHLKEKSERAERRLNSLLKDALEREAEALIAEAPAGPHGPVVARHLPDREPSETGTLAALIARRGGIALLIGGGEEPRAQFSAPAGTMAMGELLGRICREHGGKGGGRPESAQGAIPRHAVEAALVAARDAVLAGRPEGCA